MHKETKMTAIPRNVKEIVFARDDYRCVLCGSNQGVPNAHVVRRSKGGMGVEQNIVTLCPDCHRAFDHGISLKRLGGGADRESLYCYLVAYLKQFYPNWTEESVTYRKGEEYGTTATYQN